MRIRNILLFGLYGRRMQDRLMFLQEVGEKGKFGWGGGRKRGSICMEDVYKEEMIKYQIMTEDISPPLFKPWSSILSVVPAYTGKLKYLKPIMRNHEFQI